MVWCEKETVDGTLGRNELVDGLYSALDKIGSKKHVIAVPPDITRFHSYAGFLTEHIWNYYGPLLRDILPATGTHTPMTRKEINAMYGETPVDLFRVHDWKDGLETLGTVPSEKVKELSEHRLDFSWPLQINERLVKEDYDLILSIGQVVPHEVIGMANYNKNIFIGTGGWDSIHKSHYLGAVYGMERIMGRIDSPVRELLDYAESHFARDLPIVYVLTVVATEPDGSTAVKGLFIGDEKEVYQKAARLSQKVNIVKSDTYLDRVVVYLDPREFRSTWLGNKSIYRTRMAIRDGGELIILAPGVKQFGEAKQIDRLIRKYGYRGKERVMDLVRQNRHLQENLAVPAHLIHGSSEGRFTITYYPGKLSKEEVESVGYWYGDLSRAMEYYRPETLTEGAHKLSNGEEFYFIRNPGLGLWTAQELR